MRTEQRGATVAFDHDMWHTTDEQTGALTHRTSSTDVPSKKRVNSKRSTCASDRPTVRYSRVLVLLVR